MTATTSAIDVPALIAENARLQAIVDRVEALAADARLHWSAAPADGTLAVVEHSGGYYNVQNERVYVRSDSPENERRDPYFPDGGQWCPVGASDEAKPLTWGELNWLDDPECDRGSVSIETFVSVDSLDAALGGSR